MMNKILFQFYKISITKLIGLFILIIVTNNVNAQTEYHDQYRPKIHFSPKAHWINDPNGMVYYNGIYHLFFQYYPDSTVWGPMHWGHTISNDLVHWQEQPIALYPDKLGYIFSGSAIADTQNTSGFGKDGKTALVAIYTNHDPVGEKAGKNDYQTQSIAYSLDNGKTWIKYSENPVLKNPGITDFRDPKVNWYEEEKKWVMTLATKDHITFYSSPNLKDWTRESEFGATLGGHGGVWECPDLFTLDYKGEKVWVLIVNINPGGPNGGSATQYFTGSFDGKTFIPSDTTTKWLDYGTDEYAGITWANTGNRKVFLGWMSNWLYANQVPTKKWRNAMTVPRELGIEKIDDKFIVGSVPVKELDKLISSSLTFSYIKAKDYTIPLKKENTSPYKLTIKAGVIKDFTINFSNSSGEKLIVGFDKGANQYYIDRSNAGEAGFSKVFAGRHIAPRFSQSDSLDLTVIIDNSSIELFADNGLTTMTDIFFPKSLLNKIHIQSPDEWIIEKLQFNTLKSIWK